MAENRKILGQTVVVAATPTVLYTVPATTETIVSSIVACNIGATERTFRIAWRKDGAALANQHYSHYDVPIPGNDTFIATVGATLTITGGADIISVEASHADVVFQAFGVEIDQ